jgi:hypothetical protein
MYSGKLLPTLWREMLAGLNIKTVMLLQSVGKSVPDCMALRQLFSVESYFSTYGFECYSPPPPPRFGVMDKKKHRKK